MSPRFRLLAGCVLLLGACSSPIEGNGGTGGTTPTGGSATGGSSTGGSSTGGATGGGTATGGKGGSGTGGTVTATGGAGGAKATGGSATGGAGTGTGGATTARDHCVDGYLPDPADETMKDGPADNTKGGQTDTWVQPEVVKWMQDHVWESAHFQWHNIRRCTKGMVDRSRDGGLDPCKATDQVPKAQEGSGDDDGLQFLAMHRHMIQSLKQLFPKHTEQFEGWDNFPTMASQMPKAWEKDWSAFPAKDSGNGMKADNPTANLSMTGFANEGAFGQWIQTSSGLHGALHFKWVRTANQDHGLGNQFTNIDNYMFWKMHGWIDKVWDKYRAAKGKTPKDKDIQDAVLFQCRHMDALAKLVKPSLNPNPGACTTPPPAETTEFATKIRPIFENSRNKCTGCHGMGGEAGLVLGGDQCLKSSDVVKNIVNKASTTGGQFKLIVPGNADQSWLYRKVSGTAAAAGCTRTNGIDCNPDVMPLGGTVTFTTAELDALKTWINNGAM